MTESGAFVFAMHIRKVAKAGEGSARRGAKAPLCIKTGAFCNAAAVLGVGSS